MTEQSENIETPGRKRKILHILWLLLFWGSSSVAVLVFTLVLLFQFSAFRRAVYPPIMEIVNSLLVARIEVEDLRFTGFGTIEIDNVRMITEGDTLANVTRIFVDADIIAILDNVIDVKSLYLQSPRVKLLRNSTTGVWNFERIAPPSTSETEPPTSETILKIGDLVLDNAYIDFIDSMAVNSQAPRMSDKKNFNPSKMQFRDFSIRLHSDEFNLNRLCGSVEIKSLQFRELNSALNMKNLSLKAVSDGDDLRIENLKVKTDDTNLKLSASVHGINLSKEINDKVLKEAEVKIKIKPSKIGPGDIEKFTEIGLKSGAEVNLKADFAGKLNDIRINELQLSPENSEINLSGRLRGITDGKIRYDLLISRSRIYKADLQKILPDEMTAGIPGFVSAGLNKVQASGSDEMVKADLDVITDLGNVLGKAEVNFASDLVYKADLTLADVNIGKIIGSPDLDSHINGSVKADGFGTDLRKMRANVDLELYDTEVAGYAFNSLILKANMANWKINIDTCRLELPKSDRSDYVEKYYLGTPNLIVCGSADMSDPDNPYYNLKVDVEALNVAELIANKYAPEYCSASISAAGYGFDPDKMRANAKIDVLDLVFHDRSEFPFSINVDVNTADSVSKKIHIESEILNLDLNGQFNIGAISEFGASQGELWANLVFNKMGQLEDRNFVPEKYRGQMYPAKFDLVGEIKDINIVNAFLDGQKIFANADVDLSAEITPQMTDIDIKKFNVRNFTYEADSLKLLLKNTYFASDIRIISEDGIFNLEKCKVNLTTDRLGGFYMDDLKIIEPDATLDISEDSIQYRVTVNINGDMAAGNSGKIIFDDMAMKLQSDWLQFDYMNELCLSNDEMIDFKLENGKIDINRLSLLETKGMRIDVSGGATMTEFDNLSIRLNSINLRNIDSLMQKFGTNSLEMVDGNIESISATANGKLANPTLSANIHTGNIWVNKIKTGIFDFNFDYSNKKASGYGTLSDAVLRTNLFKIDIRSFPMDLSLDLSDSTAADVQTEVPGEISIALESDSLPLAVVSPFIPAITKLNGSVKMNISVEGKDLEHLNYSGRLDLPNFDFILDANNVHYSGKSQIVFNNESVELHDTKIFNDAKDYKNGSAELSGKIDLDGFDIKGFDFSLSSKGLLVLNKNSAKALPMIYGNLLVSTGENPLKVNGNLSYLDITGDVNIIRGSLFMPQMTMNNSAQSRILYKVLKHDNNNRIYYNVIDNTTNDTLYSEMKDPAEKFAGEIDTINATIDEKVTYTDIADNITMNMNFRVLNPIMLKMDLGVFGMLVAKIGTANSTIPLNFFYDTKSDMKLNGEIQLLDGSKLTYAKQFDTQGKISFPFGTVSNPLLDLTATYTGKNYVNDKAREFKVYLYMTGAFSNPSIKFSYEMDGEEAKGDSTQISQDALFLIVLGRTKTEIEAGTSTSGGSEFGSLGMSGLSAAFSKTMTELLGGTGNIESAEIDMGNGNNWQDARIKVSGKLFDNVQWRIGGDLNDITNNSEFSLDIPMDIVLHPNYLNNIVWQISHSTNTQQTTINKNQKEWEIKLKFGGSW